MNHKAKTNTIGDSTCEKYINKMLRQENLVPPKKPPLSKAFNDKLHTFKPPSVQPPRQKPKNHKPQSILHRITPVLSPPQKDQGMKELKKPRSRHRSESECQSDHKVREAWGQVLQNGKSRDKVSTFSNFDPLRTLHFLSKELYTKLEAALPGDDELLEMVSDIRHALKRIPPEISTLLHNPLSEYPETSLHIAKNVSTKSCQTPPTLFKEDTETFQKIMEENTYKLEASCKQLEMVCTSLQNEKEMAERELEEARDNMEMLCRRIKELEYEMAEMSNIKIKQLEEEKQQLQEQLDKATEELNNNPTTNHLKKVVEELKRQKLLAEETSARLEYDMTILKMEKEKLLTILSVRDREVLDIKDQMCKIQEQVEKQLLKLNSDVIKKASSVKMIHDNGIENIFLDIGDTTISSITTNEAGKDTTNFINESPSGDAGLAKDALDKLKASTVTTDLAAAKDQESGLEDLLEGLTPSMKALITSHNL